jgi:death-on-curing protein
MIRYLSVQEVLDIHAEVIRLHGGSSVILDLGLVDSAVAQPQAAFGGYELLPTLEEKAAALGYSLSKNHGFADGNKRVGFTAMDVFLRLNGFKVVASVDDAERVGLSVAAGTMTREEFTDWVRAHVVPLTPAP